MFVPQLGEDDAAGLEPTRQTEALRRLHACGAQTVRIERVHVNEGGQVATRGR